MLKTPLSQGRVRIIGSTTFEEYKKTVEKDRALSRRFSTLEIKEPSSELTLQILESIKDQLEAHHNVRYTQSALDAAILLSVRHLADSMLPDKAIDVLDEAGSFIQLLRQKKVALDTDSEVIVDEGQIAEVVSIMTRVPIHEIRGSSSDEQISSLKSLDKQLAEVIFGQEDGINSVVRAVKRSRANLAQHERPVGCFLFAGPTGVGKTELARSLAKKLGIYFHRFDMSEYMEKHSVARLVGAPPGYVGYEEGGLLTDIVRKNPNSVVLLDEIEKAHYDIYNLLLQIMDAARLTDSHGKTADFRHVILIMTTNAGSEKASALGFGFNNNRATRDQREKAIKDLFRPEFRNRLDEIIYFNSLSIRDIERIVDKHIELLKAQLAESKVSIDVTHSARLWLAERGFDEFLGARPMARTIQREINDILADAILFGALSNGGDVSISVIGNNLHFDFTSTNA
jgi:ATP-dependent Clp protease ATP-binding subunit ClpA